MSRLGRVRDLWWTTGARGPKRKTARHPDNGGDKDAKRWLAVWADPGGRERTKAFGVKALAAEHARKMATDVARGDYLDPALGKAQVSVLGTKWLSLLETGARTRIRYEQAFRLHVVPKFGARPAGGIQPSEIAAWSRSMAAHPGTRQLALMILTGIFDLAVADGVRRDNPCKASVVAPVRVPKRERQPWPASRVLAVAGHCGAYSALPVAAAGLGLRAGEVFALAGEDVDEDAGVVHVRRQVTTIARQAVFKLPKGGKARTVPLSRGVGALLASRPGSGPLTLPWLNEDGSLGKPVTAALLWLWHDGRHIRGRLWDWCVWKPALAAAGVIGPRQGQSWAAPEHGMHALRHWYSTCLLDAGVSLAGVMEFLGHSRRSVPLSIGVYGHVTPDTLQAARNAVDRALFRPRIVGSDGTGTELATG